MIQRAVENTENSLERIKRQLASASGKNLLQGPLLKRSETVINFPSFYFLAISSFSLWLSIFCFITTYFLLTSKFQFLLHKLGNHDYLTIPMCYRFSDPFNMFILFWDFLLDCYLAHVKIPFFVLIAEKMERTLGDFGPNNWENGIQVGVYMN